MKKTFQLLGLFTIVCFSFFATEKTISVIKEQDPIMIKLNSIYQEYYQAPVNATIKGNTIIPGLSGTQLDIDQSYTTIKKIGRFDTQLLKYKEVSPSITLKENKDKYIISGNTQITKVALIFIIEKNTDINKLTSILKNTKVNYFITAEYLNANIKTVKELSINNEIYNYGYNGNYTESLLVFTNNLINQNTNNKSIYCLTQKEDKNTLKTCNAIDNYVIMPSIITGNTPYNEIKNQIKNGSIILMNINTQSLIELPSIINFINSKGYQIVTLSNLLNEVQ